MSTESHDRCLCHRHSKKKVEVLVCYAVKEEVGRNTQSLGCTVLVTGMGSQNASENIRRALDSESYRLVLTCGFAGGLNPLLDAGMVVYSEDIDSQLAAQLSRAGAVAGKFHTSQRVAITVAEKKALRESTGADAVEMESSVIRSICRERGIESATIRVISDTAREDLPLDFNALMTPNLRINYGKLIQKVVTSPGKIFMLLNFQKQTRRAAQELDRVVSGLLQGI